MKKLFLLAIVLAFVLAPLSSLRADAGSWNGWIADDSCAAHPEKAATADHAACTKKCMAKGAKLVFINDADHKVYKLDKQDVAKEHIGHAVTVKGEVKDNAIAVSSIEPMAAPSK